MLKHLFKTCVAVLAIAAAATGPARGQNSYNVTFSGLYSSSLNTTVNVTSLPQTFTSIGGTALAPGAVIDGGDGFTAASVTSGGNGMVSVSVSITAYTGTIDGGFYMIKITGGTASVKVYGNIMSLVDETGYETATTVAEKAFRHLFQDNSTLTDASGLLLPAMTLAQECYGYMFEACGALTAAPALPATTLANSCYSNMFYGCTNLEAAPVLPAETLVTNCYQNMFNNCLKLASVTCMATSGINTNNSTGWWLENAGTQATGTKTFTAVSTATWPSSNNGIPSGWTREDYTE